MIKRAGGWIKRHQITVSFIITFTITWGLGFTVDAVMNRGNFLLAPLAFVSFCGPALAGIIVTTVSNTLPRQGSRAALWLAFAVAWLISALVFLSHSTLINEAPPSSVSAGFTLVSVVPVALVISMACSRMPPVRDYVPSLIRVRGVWGWAIVAAATIPALVLLSIPASNLLAFGREAPFQLPSTGLSLTGLVTVKFLYQLFFNATGEEAGRRGFALPRLQAGVSPLAASLIIALFWVLWHLMFYRAKAERAFSWRFWVMTLALHVPGSVIIGWLYNRSGGSILVAGMAHAAAPTTIDLLLPSLEWPVYVSTITLGALILILIDRMWKRLPPDHPAVYGLPAGAVQ